MYKIQGADGKEYGPVTIDQLRNWVAQGRVNEQTRVQAMGGTEWTPAGQVPELALLFGRPLSASPRPGTPPPLPAARGASPQQGLAIFSFVLGLVSFVLCLSVLTGIPAVICGHIARRRAIRFPAKYSGAGLALAGIILGYVSLIFSLVIAGLLLPAISQARRATQWQRQRPMMMRSDCQNNLRQIGLSFKLWALEHNDRFPFNVSTNSGGTLELCGRDPDGFDTNALAHFLAISGELSSPHFLVCPRDSAKHAASSFDALHSDNITYLLRTGTNVNGDHPQEVLAVCPVDGNTLFCDGNVRKGVRPRP